MKDEKNKLIIEVVRKEKKEKRFWRRMLSKAFLDSVNVFVILFFSIIFALKLSGINSVAYAPLYKYEYLCNNSTEIKASQNILNSSQINFSQLNKAIEQNTFVKPTKEACEIINKSVQVRNNITHYVSSFIIWLMILFASFSLAIRYFEQI